MYVQCIRAGLFRQEKNSAWLFKSISMATVLLFSLKDIEGESRLGRKSSLFRCTLYNAYNKFIVCIAKAVPGIVYVQCTRAGLFRQEKNSTWFFRFGCCVGACPTSFVLLVSLDILEDRASWLSVATDQSRSVSSSLTSFSGSFSSVSSKQEMIGNVFFLLYSTFTTSIRYFIKG